MTAPELWTERAWTFTKTLIQRVKCPNCEDSDCNNCIFR